MKNVSESVAARGGASGTKCRMKKIRVHALPLKGEKIKKYFLASSPIFVEAKSGSFILHTSPFSLQLTFDF
jgi:hypothetical protein